MSATVHQKRIPVSESNVRKAALRLLTNALVTPEVHYVQHILGNTATQLEIDEKVLAVRQMPWASIVVPE